MARWYGVIGYDTGTEETKPGVWVEQITERNYYGDVIRNTRRLQSGESVNDDLIISNEISIIADPYAIQNFHAIRYASYMGAKWKVSNVTVQDRRLNLTLGGVWNGEQA